MQVDARSRRYRDLSEVTEADGSLDSAARILRESGKHGQRILYVLDVDAHPSIDARMNDPVPVGPPVTRPVTPPPAHSQVLDGLRGFAMFSVFLFHGALTAPRVAEFAPRVLAHLDTGVQVFFVLSGFLMYRPFAAAHFGGGPSPSLSRYFIRRAARVYPGYWLALGALVALGSISVAGAPWRHIALVQTYFRDTGSAGLAVAWTLTVEVSFYVLVPLWSLVIRRCRARAFTAELVGVAILAAVGIGCRLWSGWATPAQAVLVLPTALVTLSVGMVLAVLSAQQAHVPRLAATLLRLGSPAGWWWLGAGGAFAIECALPYGFFRATASEITRDQLLRMPIAFLLVFPCVFGAGGWLRQALSSRPMVFFGTISYGMYLWHTSVIREFDGYTVLPNNLQFVVSFVVTGVVATASWFLLERPILTLVHGRTLSEASAPKRTEAS